MNDHLNQALEDQLWKKSKTGFNLANYNMNNSLSVSIGRVLLTHENVKIYVRTVSISLTIF